jgi:TRAP-type C4-dicarboxylate transport system permease small subunit
VRPDGAGTGRPAGRRGPAGLVERLTRFWALAGGAVVLAVVAVNLAEVATVATRPLTGWRFTGAVELTEMGVAVAGFAFLPWCQIAGANVAADIFTARAGRRLLAALRLAAAAVALGFALLMLWRMGLGAADQRAFGTSTAILALPLWWAYWAILPSLVLWVLAGLVTLAEAGTELRRAWAPGVAR